MKLTKAQMLIAAAMCEARKVELKHDSTEDEIEAADFIFNAGIFYLGHEGCDIAAEQFRAMAAGRAALEKP